MNDLFLLKDETYRILGACFEVYNELGCGFLESVYHECLAIEFAKQEIPFESKKTIRMTYKGTQLERWFEVDFDCFESVLVEVKAVRMLTGEHRAQLLNYLHAAPREVGLLVNFGHYPKLEYERLFARDVKGVGAE